MLYIIWCDLNTLKGVSLLNILYEDKHLLICVKPPGVPSQPDLTGSADMTALIKDHLNLKPDSFIGVVHRLDRPVGGVMVYTKTKESLAFLNKEIQNQRFNKVYLAVCCGNVPEETVLLEDFLLKNGRTNTSSTVVLGTPNAKKALLEFKCLANHSDEIEGPLGLLQVHLMTGRHHQIRVQLAHHNLPLWGDTKYNPLFAKRSGWFFLGLWSYALSFKHPFKKEHLSFSTLPTEQPFSYFADTLQML